MSDTSLARRRTFEYLSMMEIFRDLTAEELQQLDQALAAVIYHRGQLIYHPDSPAERLFLLKEGGSRSPVSAQRGKNSFSHASAPDRCSAR